MNKCPFSKECGGCDYIDLDYNQTLVLKEKYLNNLFKNTKYKKKISIIGMEEPYYYRNKVIQAPKISKRGNVVSGIYAAFSHNIIVVDNCMIQNKEINDVIGLINKVLTNNRITPYVDGGFLKHVLVRHAHKTKEILIVFVTKDKMFPGRNNVVKELVTNNNNIKTIVQNIQPRNTPIVLGDEEQVIYGSGYITDYLDDKVFKISSKSFYQVNSIQTEILYKTAIKNASLRPDDIVIDAYSGIGTIAIFLSGHVKKVIAVENNKEAVNDAKMNIKNNKITNIDFYLDDSTKFLNNLAKTKTKIDCLFLDPPRTGTTYEFIKSIALMKIKHVVYVSCGPETLVRDLQIFDKFGYEINKVDAVDMFPFTKGIESIVLLVRKEK